MEATGPDAAGEGTTLVVLPTYDEARTLADVVTGIRAHAAAPEVLVVDDGSPDGTGQLADDLAAADRGVHVLHRGRKAGLGAAYRVGFGWGLERGHARLVAMDADGSHDPAVLPTLLAASAAADVVIGSRYVPGGGIDRWAWWRRALSRGGNAYARTLTGVPVRDLTSGYRVLRRPVLEAIDVASLASDGYAFQLEVAWRAWRAGFALTEVPIRFVERTDGASKLSRGVVAEAVWRTASWAARGARSDPSPHPASVRGQAPGAGRVNG